MIRPHLEYASCVWSPYLKRDQDAIERVQRRATKIVPGISHLSYTERLQFLNLPTLKYRRERADLIETFRIMNQQHELNLHCRCSKCPNKEMLQMSHNTHTRGHSKKLLVQESTGRRSNFFSSRVITDWNNLEETTVSATTVEQFKRLLQEDWARESSKMFDYRFSY